ncbi:hypothetical protein FV232_24540 [Methylobacterium sp. WL30]|jgi:hypothetical protein|uniref:hypothetical protein n=1 Tax=unclassified Methylobacterium TaxID=2615210 RepID=UPI0011C9B2A5|nr:MULTISPECIES: hypothetical protein [unclassified Methylobacterium]TXM94350.1 hypothetical protein FV223_05000 [Methylobacterium sp. WL116]TXN39352.1 hypothetical protein FV225_10210 [Methylobacterium sp. WL93]TXN62861.1 hypothetical protein FV232_24540 [Methylobacterium sp. WL30]TXN64338.1 hypothetical protein FV230_18630 [Methylobacterium sp. WL6]
MVSLNTYAVTQPALEGFDPTEDGFHHDVTSWLHDGFNTLTVVLIGPPGEVPFRMVVRHGDHSEHVLDEADFLPLATPWRLWTLRIERASVLNQHLSGLGHAQPRRVASDQIMPGAVGGGMSLRVDQIRAPASLVSMATPDQPSRIASARNLP